MQRQHIECSLNGVETFHSAPDIFAGRAYRSDMFNTSRDSYYSPRPGEVCQVVVDKSL